MRIGWRTDDPPSEREKYLVQLDSGEMAICEWSNVNPFWTNLTTDWHWFNRPQYTKVVAWHALPQPYRKTEPTISKMEQVETMSCQECKHWNVYKGCRERVCKYEPKDEPQTYVINPQEPTNDDKCFECDDFFTCGGQCNKIEDEPQTDCAWR